MWRYLVFLLNRCILTIYMQDRINAGTCRYPAIWFVRPQRQIHVLCRKQRHLLSDPGIYYPTFYSSPSCVVWSWSVRWGGGFIVYKLLEKHAPREGVKRSCINNRLLSREPRKRRPNALQVSLPRRLSWPCVSDLQSIYKAESWQRTVTLDDSTPQWRLCENRCGVSTSLLRKT